MVTLATERIVRPVEGMHLAIAAPWFAALGAAGKPVRVVHDVISRVVYGSIRIGAEVVGVGLDTRVAADSSSADSALAFVNGLWGDALGRHEPRLGSSMSVRDARGALIPLGPEITEAFSEATGRLVVFVHGLINTERSWTGTGAGPGLIDSVEDHPDLTPVAIRYNTGRAVATNGAQLASLLEVVHAAWPQPVQSIALVGHSMGGLVIRSACAAALHAGHRWIGDVSDVVTIGSPHGGAPLERFVNAAAFGLSAAPQTRPLAEFLNTRSRGIKDLRAGSIGYTSDDDPSNTTQLGGWCESSRGGSPHRQSGAYGGASEPEQAIHTSLLGHIRHRFVGGVITSNPTHPIGGVVGDLMVRPASSTRVPRVQPADVVVVGGVNHFSLLRKPAVVNQVMVWLAPPP